MDCLDAQKVLILENRIKEKESARKEAAAILDAIKIYGRHLWMGRDRTSWPKRTRILEKLERIVRGK